VSNVDPKNAISTDGVNWDTGYPTTDAYSLTYGNGKFVAIAHNSTTGRYSGDGKTWNSNSYPSGSWSGITYGNGKFVAVSTTGTGEIMYSSDGITWATTTASIRGQWSDVTYGNGVFVAISSSSTVPGIITSSDGINWATHTGPSISGGTSNPFAITYGNGMFVAVGNNSGTNQVYTSGKTYITDFTFNNVYRGGMSVVGGAFNIGTTTSSTDPARFNIFNIASSTGSMYLTLTSSGNLGLGTSSPSARLSVLGSLGSSQVLFDVASTTSSAGATSSLFTVLANENARMMISLKSKLCLTNKLKLEKEGWLLSEHGESGSLTIYCVEIKRN
jgi:hypothetical protein